MEMMEDSSTSEESFLANDVNIDSITAYLDWKFPGKQLETFINQLTSVLNDFPYEKYKTLAHVDNVINKTESVRSKIFQELGYSKEHREYISAAIELAVAFCLVDDNFFSKAGLLDSRRNVISKYRQSYKSRQGVSS